MVTEDGEYTTVTTTRTCLCCVVCHQYITTTDITPIIINHYSITTARVQNVRVADCIGWAKNVHTDTQLFHSDGVNNNKLVIKQWFY